MNGGQACLASSHFNRSVPEEQNSPHTRISFSLGFQLLIVMLLAISLTNCGSNKNSSDDEINYSGTGKSASARKKGEAPPLLPASNGINFIKSISIAPNKVAAGTEIKVTLETSIPADLEHELSFLYWKNGELLIETDKSTLSPSLFRKNEYVYAEVLLKVKGKVLEKAKSEPILIANTAPIITLVNIPQISGPGTYTITVKADDVDSDTLTFSLLPAEGQSLFEGLSINSTDGTITLTLGDTVPPENMLFIVAADDGDGGVTKKMVTIPFTITRQTVQSSEEK